MHPPLPRVVIERQASRGHRLQHFLWHETRNRWLLPVDRGGLTDEVKQQLRDLGWEPPRPALGPDRRPILDNYSGEDFLYMHRRMIAGVDDLLHALGDPSYPRVVGWSQLPAPDDPDFPVPPPWFIPWTPGPNQTWRDDPGLRLASVKTREFFDKRLRFWERQFTDPTYLRGLSLGELGARLEFTVHNQLHNRFSAQPPGERPDPDPDPAGSIPAQWDDPRYDYLGDTYSSHVNPVFWKLHGWVDDRIEDWRFANGVFGAIAWQGTWEGVLPAVPPGGGPGGGGLLAAGAAGHGESAHAGHDHGGHSHGDHSHHELARLEAAVRVLGKCPGRYTFLDFGWFE